MTIRLAAEPQPAGAGRALDLRGRRHRRASCWAAKTRYRQSDAECRIENAEGARLSLSFETPQWAVTPGQSAVLYDGEVCLGGGIIVT
jgi:tRNA U34 2-thiouridine synthase MnmA/TrmU